MLNIIYIERMSSDDDTTFQPDINLIEVAYETVEGMMSEHKISEGAYYALCRSIKLAYDHTMDSEYESDDSIDDFIVDDDESISGGLTDSEFESDSEEEEEEEEQKINFYYDGIKWGLGGNGFLRGCSGQLMQRA